MGLVFKSAEALSAAILASGGAAKDAPSLVLPFCHFLSLYSDG